MSDLEPRVSTALRPLSRAGQALQEGHTSASTARRSSSRRPPWGGQKGVGGEVVIVVNIVTVVASIQNTSCYKAILERDKHIAQPLLNKTEWRK